ncbi:MAG: TetR/AcrR family transcriptional regulator [Luteibacter sp.]
MAAGRPRSFDITQALDHAIEVFMAKGYDGATLTDLTEAMGINPPSLYAAFGSKEGLFRQALTRYEEERDAKLRDALAASTATETVRRFLHDSVEEQTRPDRAHGCLFIQGGLACGTQGEQVREPLTLARLGGYRPLADRFRAAQDTGEISKDTDPEALARYVCALVHGLAVQAASGVPRDQMLAVVDMTMHAWRAAAGAAPRA